jgi:predicted O-methyltransferase YrrM
MIPARFVLFGLPPVLRQIGLAARWVVTSKEYYNWTYDLAELNQRYLASYIAVVTGHDQSVIEGYIRELENDQALRSLLIERTLQSPDRHSSDVEPRYGKRLGWYALVRATKPRVIVETGVDRGLGTAVIAAALMQNEKEGFPGMVYATDIAADCGHLLAEPYKKYCQIFIGDSIESLKKFDKPTDIFLHDSCHEPDYEWAEFMAIEPRLHPASLVLSDNSLLTSKLLEFGQRLGKSFLYFQDQPKDHWWPGDGIGTTFVPGAKTYFPDTRTGQNPA